MINLGLLREEGATPRVHGNGFIQLDLDERSRLHVWGDPEIPQQKVSTPIHDHVFGFESVLVVGRLINIRYDWCPRAWGTLEVYTAQCRKGSDTQLNGTKDYGYAEPTKVEVLNWCGPVWQYRVHPFDFHESIATEPTVTIIKKNNFTLEQGSTHTPRVLVPRRSKPDNTFDRHSFDEDMLWRIIEKTLARSTTR